MINIDYMQTKLDKNLISEIDLLKAIEDARKEYKEGKTVSAKSMANLIYSPHSID